MSKRQQHTKNMGRSGPRKPKTRQKEKEASVTSVVASKPKSGALEKPSVALIQRQKAQRARVRALKPYLRVPDLPDPPPPNSDGSETPSEPQPLPKAETIYRNHLDILQQVLL